MTTKQEKSSKPAAFIFGTRPENITAPVKFQSVTGAFVDIPCQFKYRTRKEFSALWDKLVKPLGADQIQPEDFSFARLADRGLRHAAESTLEFLSDWPLEIELNVDNIVRLFDEEPAAQEAFWNTYRLASNEGRLGN